jgi:magnesium transporter
MEDVVDSAQVGMDRLGPAGSQTARFIEDRDFQGLRTFLEGFENYDLADLLAALTPGNKAVAFRVLSRERAGEVFSYFDPRDQHRLLRAFGQAEVAAILDEMPSDDRTALLEILPSEIQRQMINLLSPEERESAMTLLGYEEGSVGRIMTSDFLTLNVGLTVAEALETIRKNGGQVETFSVLYIVDSENRLIDNVGIRRVLLAQPGTPLAELLDSSTVSLCAEDPAEEAVKVFQETDLFALPVTTRTGKLLGIVTMDDVIDLAEERATRSMQKFGGSAEFADPYLRASWGQMMLKRGPWLVVLFLSGLLTANAMAFFEGEIERAAVLMIFLPLIIASGGNSGSQAATLIIRSLATGEVRLRDGWAVLQREIVNGASLGLLLGAIGMGVVAVGSRFTTIFTSHWPLVGLSVGAALLCVVLWGSVVGAMLPLILRACRLDPATSSAPFVSTLVDVTGIVIYFSIASWILRGTLL